MSENNNAPNVDELFASAPLLVWTADVFAAQRPDTNDSADKGGANVADRDIISALPELLVVSSQTDKR